MKIKKPTKEQLKLLKKLYLNSFPKYERKPFSLMRIWEKLGKMEILCICNDTDFGGLVITVLYGDLVLIDYFAVSEEIRGTGIGSQAIDLIRERYKGKRIFLEIESTLKPCDDLIIRKRRKSFYLRNGLTECGISVMLFGVEMELLAFDKSVTYEEYYELYNNLGGRIVTSKISEIR